MPKNNNNSAQDTTESCECNCQDKKNCKVENNECKNCCCKDQNAKCKCNSNDCCNIDKSC